MSEKLADMLQLNSLGSRIMETGTFGQPQAMVTERELVTLHVGHLYEEDGVQVEAFTVPVICKALQNQHVEGVHPYLNKLWFSDVCPREENLEVDLLVGADYLWEFMKGDVVRGERDEPVAILTSLGWVLSGPLKIPARTDHGHKLGHTHSGNPRSSCTRDSTRTTHSGISKVMGP